MALSSSVLGFAMVVLLSAACSAQDPSPAPTRPPAFAPVSPHPIRTPAAAPASPPSPSSPAAHVPSTETPSATPVSSPPAPPPSHAERPSTAVPPSGIPGSSSSAPGNVAASASVGWIAVAGAVVAAAAAL